MKTIMTSSLSWPGLTTETSVSGCISGGGLIPDAQLKTMNANMMLEIINIIQDKYKTVLFFHKRAYSSLSFATLELIFLAESFLAGRITKKGIFVEFVLYKNHKSRDSCDA